MTKYNLLGNRQNGFRQGHSTETTLLSFFDDLYTSLANNKSQQLILLDLSSAFDTLEFNTIIDRLQNIGLKDIPLLWFKNLLFNRSFTIKISNSISSVKHPIKYGVPQRSVLSPIIFAIFFTSIQHIFNKYPNVNYNLYAVDIELHSNIESLDQLQNCLIDLHNWLTTNELLLNSTKKELINISTAKLNIESEFPKIFINDIPIISPNSTKYLGVKFDNKLNFDQHILTLKQTTTYLYKTYINCHFTYTFANTIPTKQL